VASLNEDIVVVLLWSQSEQVYNYLMSLLLPMQGL